MSPEEYYWKDVRPRGRTVKAEKKDRGFCIVEREGGMVQREIYVSRETMRQIGLDCLRLVKETGGNLS